MSKPPFALYGDAVKLILVGSTTEPLSPEQRSVFAKMLARRMHTRKDKKKVAKRQIANVRSKTRRDEETGTSETIYCIPDVLLYMVEAFDDWGMMTPPVDRTYLRQLISQLDEPGLPSKALRWLDIRRDLATLDRSPGGGPIGGETQSDVRLRLERDLEDISKQIKKARSGGLQNAASALAEQWKKEGKKDFTKHDIAVALAVSDEWNHKTAATIERNIRAWW